MRFLEEKKASFDHDWAYRRSDSLQDACEVGQDLEHFLQAA